jgi:3-deoxy-D-manno-octulosonic acid (KDO) 8-phosphate synthase
MYFVLFLNHFYSISFEFARSWKFIDISSKTSHLPYGLQQEIDIMTEIKKQVSVKTY